MHFQQVPQKFNKEERIRYSQLHRIPRSSLDKGFNFLNNTPTEIPTNTLPTWKLKREKQYPITTHIFFDKIQTPYSPEFLR